MFGLPGLFRSSDRVRAPKATTAAKAAAPARRPLMEMLEDRRLMSVTAAPVATKAAVVKPAAATVYPLGTGLQEQKGSSLDDAFADMIKTSQSFKNLSGGNATLDAAGWPTQDFQVTVKDTAYASGPVDAGKYNITFTGSASTVLTASGSAGMKLTKIGPTAYTLDIPAGTPGWP